MDRFCSTIFLHLVIGVLISNTLQEERLNVQLEIKNITVCEGESVTVNCTFQPAGEYKVRLYYSLTSDLDCTSTTVRTNEKWHNSENNDTWSTFSISSIKTDDSGWYFCRVTGDIPLLKENCSDGIQVLVDANSGQEYPNQTDNRTDNLTQNLPKNVFCNTFQEELNVQLEPKNITVCEGESVTVNCTFQPAGEYKVRLYHSLTSDLGCTTVRTNEKWHNSENNDTWSTFSISSIKTDDSGWYFCSVTGDIPVLKENCSDGIQVLVDANSGQEYPNQTDNRTDNLTQNLPKNVFCNTFQEELNVQLEPKNITVCEGESVTVNCTFQPAGKYKVKLYNSLTSDLGCTTVRTREKWHNSENNDTWSTFSISSIKTDDSGWYFCRVTSDIPVLKRKCSDRIQVVVHSTCRIMTCI